MSSLFHNMLELCKSIHRATTAYFPQTNGMGERFNHTLAEMLSMYVDADHTNWYVVLYPS